MAIQASIQSAPEVRTLPELAERLVEARDELQHQINTVGFPVKNRAKGARLGALLEARNLLDEILADVIVFRVVAQ